MKTTVSFNADDAEDLQRAINLIKRLGASEVTARVEQRDAPTVYDEIWSMLSAQTDDQFEALDNDETDQEFFRRLVAGINEFPNAVLSAAADAWFDSVIDVPVGEDIAAPPGFYAAETNVEVAAPARPRDRLAEYAAKRKARAATVEPALAKPKQKRGRKPKAAATDGAEKTDEPVTGVDVETLDLGDGDDIEVARTHLRALSLNHGVEWLRQALAQQGVRKLSELDDNQVRVMLNDIANFGDAAA